MLTTLAVSTSWKSVEPPVEPTQPKASCFGIPLDVVHEDDGYRPAGTAGSVPDSVVRDPNTGVNATLYVPAATVRPEAVVNDAAVELIATSTGTFDKVRLELRSVSAGDDVFVAVLLTAQ
jgi:hypothetical protein